MSRAVIETFDGLSVGFGRHVVDNDVAAVTQGANGIVTVTQELILSSLVDTPSDNAPAQAHVIPRGSIFVGGYVQSIVGASASTSLLSIGTWSRGLATEIDDDFDGLVDAVDDALLANVGDVLVMDGALIADSADSNLAVAGAVSNSDVVIVSSFDTNVHTAGVVRIVTRYLPPTGTAGRALAV